jgi:SOS response regulatory protein OraA/RecX
MTETTDELYTKTYVKLLNFISYKARTVRETVTRAYKYLEKAKLSDQDKEALITRITDQLKEEGYLNDQKLADTVLAGYQSSSKAMSVRKLKTAFMKKGLERGVLDNVFSHDHSDLELDHALKDAEKKLRYLTNESPNLKKLKLMKFLFSRGYAKNTISSVVDSLL